MVFQNYALYPHMTVRDNMRFGLEQPTRTKRSSPNESERQRSAQIEELLERGRRIYRRAATSRLAGPRNRP